MRVAAELADEGTAKRPTYVEIVMCEDRWGNHVLRACCPTTGRSGRVVVPLDGPWRLSLSTSLHELVQLLDEVLPDEVPP